jgi:hypothetical protein
LGIEGLAGVGLVTAAMLVGILQVQGGRDSAVKPG